jgi:hypothetical protein
MADSFSYKLVSDNELFAFDFSQVLVTNETLVSAACSVIVMSGTDTNPTAILYGSPTVSGSVATQRIYSGVSEVTYRLVMTVTTSVGNIYTAVGDLPIYDPSLV